MKAFRSVTVLNGHIHQALQKIEGNIRSTPHGRRRFPSQMRGTAPAGQWLSSDEAAFVSRTDECVLRRKSPDARRRDSTLASAKRVMDTAWWVKAHGARTHFSRSPGTLFSLVRRAAFWLAKPVDRARAARGWLLDNPARRISSVPAIVSGLVMTEGQLARHGALADAPPVLRGPHLHCSWRSQPGECSWGSERRDCFRGLPYRRRLAAGLVSATGYWGGEMMIAR